MFVWRSFYRDRVRHGLVYAYMVWIWRFVFSTAVFDHLRVSAVDGRTIFVELRVGGELCAGQKQLTVKKTKL